MNQDRRHSLFNWLLGVPGTLVQITGWFLVLLSMGEIFEGSNTPPLLLAAAFILSIATFLVGRLMSLACDLLTGSLAIPEKKRSFVVSLIYQLSVQLLLAAMVAQLIVLMRALATSNQALIMRSVPVLVLIVVATVATQVSSDRFRKKVRREWEELRSASQDDD